MPNPIIGQWTLWTRVGINQLVSFTLMLWFLLRVFGLFVNHWLITMYWESGVYILPYKSNTLMKTNTLTKRRRLSQYRREKIESWFKFTSPCFWPLDEYRLFIIFPVVHEMMRRVPLHGSPIYKESQVDPDFWHGFRIGLAKVFHMSREGNFAILFSKPCFSGCWKSSFKTNIYPY